MELFQRNGQKVRFVHFIRKKGNPSDPNNYRGITLLSCLRKLFTAVLNERLTSYLEDNNMIGDEQAGFRNGHSTLDHIMCRGPTSFSG